MPEPERSPDLLSDPALTGMSRQEMDNLVKALAPDGDPKPGRPPRLVFPDQVLATVLHLRVTEGDDLQELGCLEVARDRRTPFERHAGERVISVQERWEPRTGRVGLQIEFESGGIACDVWASDLRLLPPPTE